MKKHILAAQARTLVGRKVKNLRKEGLVPATIYGKNVKSTSVSVSKEAFVKVYEEAGETGLVELTVDKETKPVLVHWVQVDPVSDAILHVEFHQVDLKEKVHANVPVELIGESPAVTGKIGVILQVLNDIEVEALPTDLPEKIAVDISSLAEVNQELKISDLVISKAVTVLSDNSLTVVKVGSLVSKEAEAQAAEEAAAAQAAAAEAPAEGAPAGDTAAPASEKAAEPAKTPEPKKE